MGKKINRRLWWPLALTLVAAVVSSAAEPFPITVEHNVPVKMRDGVTLRADIYRPLAEGKFPVLLARTPYGKTDSLSHDLHFGVLAASRGYVVVLQDVRGRFASEGEWYAFKYEIPDGYDTVEWAAALPYANGQVGMVGASYLGFTQLCAAVAAPPHLVAIFPDIAPSGLYENLVYRGGAFSLAQVQRWSSGMSLEEARRRLGERWNADPFWGSEQPPASYRVLDTGNLGRLAAFYFDWLRHPAFDDYWKQWSIEGQAEKVQSAAYHVGGWYDQFCAGTLRNYISFKTRAGSEKARRSQRLMIGPWMHGPHWQKVGEIDFGPQASLGVLAEDEVFRWYDHILKGMDNGINREKPVKIFVMGRNAWRGEDDWPLARARSTRYYLNSGGRANTLNGDGTLSTAPPQNEPADRYTYDPADPVTTRAIGAFDQRPLEAREDVLVFSAPPLQQDLEVTGPTTLELYASSSAVDTDFTGKLVDVWPNGYAQNLTEGILRARYRNSWEKPELMKPGGVYRFTIDLAGTSNVFLAGHRIRLEISSSNFPRFDRNLNTGEDQARGTHWLKATNVIYHDRAHPSALLLPVVPVGIE